MANKYAVEILPLAIEDIDRIFAYYFEQSLSLDVAEKVVSELETAIYNLEDFPKAHPLSDIKKLAGNGYRKLIIENYIALYKIDEKNKRVIIARIFHGMTDYSKYI